MSFELEAVPILKQPKKRRTNVELVEVDDGLSEDIIPNYKSADAVSAYSSTDYENMVDGSDSQLSVVEEFISVHCHKTAGDDKADYGARKALLLSMLLCVIFMTAEIVGGYLAGSLAIITDAAHLLTDLASFLISLFSMYMASREATRKLSFGWHRAEVLGALVSVILIWLITGILVYIAAERIIYNDFDIDARIMLILAAVGVIVNFVMGTVLQLFGGHGHSHGQSVNYSRSSSQTRRNINVRAAFIHVLGDFIQSVGVLVAALIIFFRKDLQIIDPICTFIFSLLVLATTVHIMKDVVNVLMEGSPRGIDFTEVIRKLGDINGVAKVHDLRIWSLTMDKIAVSVHLAIYREQNAQEVLLKATTLLRDQYHVFECTVQIEHFSEDMQGCQRCEPPKR